MKFITFSKEYPKGHGKAGQPTWFIQKILHSLVTPGYQPATEIGWPAKFHTIRAGNRIKLGETISLRYWTDKPYRSKQAEICKVKVISLWQFVVTESNYYVDGNQYTLPELTILAKNDGLEVSDFEEWFAMHPKKKGDVFKGQIICWSELINY